MTLHHAFKKGTTIFLVFKDGTKLVTKFLDAKGKGMITKDGFFKYADLRSSGVYRQS